MESMTLACGLVAAEPAVPPAPYLGGKRNLASRIIARLAAIPQVTYAEPFVGMGGVFLRRPFRARAEVVNDVSGDVANLFRVLQRHYEALMDMLRWQITSRSEFARLQAAHPGSLTDLERAARFLYLQRAGFGGKIEGRNFGVSVANTARFDVAKLGPLLERVHDRLSGVVIEQMGYGELLARYDRPGTLFYLDPPYAGNEADYGPGVFTPPDFARLATQLATLRGQWLLSINDTPEVRTLFNGCHIDLVPTTYGINGTHPKRVQELLIGPSGGV